MASTKQMKTVTDEWDIDGYTFTRTYTEEQIMRELDDIWGTEEYQNLDHEDSYAIHNRAEHLEELLKEITIRKWA